jgi:hypothetical protein
MFLGSTILEIAIGLALIFLLFSVICSALNEWLAGILKLRSTTLRQGIQTLLADPNAQGLAKAFFEHPLFKGLSLGSKQSFPSYIPARTFARILIDIVSPAGTEHRDLTALYRRVRDFVANLSGTNDELGKAMLILIDEAGVNPAKLEESARALQKLEQTRRDLLDFVTGAGNEIAQIEFAATALQKLNEVEATLRRAEEEATAALYQAQANVEDYFNESMERLSGWYKRRVQVFIFGFALAICIVLNVDTFAITSRLFIDPALRQALVTAAEQQPGFPATGDDPLAVANAVRQQIGQLGIPIGWQGAPAGPVEWIAKVLGLLVSTVAIAQGAPFWFDLLGKLLNVRMTGKKPATTEEKTNEPQK